MILVLNPRGAALFKLIWLSFMGGTTPHMG